MTKRKKPQKILEKKEARKNGATSISKNTETTPTRRRRAPSERDANKLMLIIISLVLLLGLIWSAFFILTRNNNDSLPENVNGEEEKTTDSKILVHGKTGKTPDEDRKNAEIAAAKIVSLAYVDPTHKKTTDQRIEALSNKDDSVVTKEFKDSIYFPRATDEDLKYNTYQTLVAMNDLLIDPKKKSNITPKNNETYKNVHLDGDRGEAFVPIGNFTSVDAVFSMEMVWVDNKWKLSPYSLVNEVKLSTLVQEKMKAALQQNSTASPLPSLPPTAKK